MKYAFYSLIPNLLNKFFNSYYILSISLGYDSIIGPPRTYRLMRGIDQLHNVTNGTIKLYTRHSRSIRNTGEEECHGPEQSFMVRQAGSAVIQPGPIPHPPFKNHVTLAILLYLSSFIDRMGHDNTYLVGCVCW